MKRSRKCIEATEGAGRRAVKCGVRIVAIRKLDDAERRTWEVKTEGAARISAVVDAGRGQKGGYEEPFLQCVVRAKTGGAV
jgi:hypothetical protein